MIKKTLVSSLMLAGALGVTTSAYAVAPNNGHAEGEWFNIRNKASVKKLQSVNLSGDAPYSAVNSKLKYDSGKNTCYGGLYWGGKDSLLYFLITVCDALGGFEQDEVTFLSELDEGHLSTSFKIEGDPFYISSIYTPTAGSTFFNDGARFIGFNGSIVMKFKFNSDGDVKSIKIVDRKGGLSDTGDLGSGVFGTTKSGFSMKRIKNLDKVPAGAVACANDVFADIVDSGTGTIERCGLGFND